MTKISARVLQSSRFTVPNYDFSSLLEATKKRYANHFCGWDLRLTDSNFSRTSSRLVPDRNYKYEILELSGYDLSKGLSTLKSNNALKLGAQGIALMFPWLRNMEYLSSIVSLDEPGPLPLLNGCIMIPELRFDREQRKWSFNLKPSETPMKSMLLSVTEE
ncbi:hypothetical protein HGA64_04450 [Candidatus Falkowbacteria bacterium]|nr:hypothetical protein [Candidatus Falkowbacteria bacterium]